MTSGLERLAELPVPVRLIREIHAKLMQGARGGRLTPGQLPTTQNWIGPGGCSLHEATFVPPPPQEVPQALSDLEHFLHIETPPPALVQVGLAHALRDHSSFPRWQRTRWPSADHVLAHREEAP